jgi:hypothetical protein
MASSSEPRSGLKYGWALGESGWNTEMDTNLKGIGRFAYHLSVKDRDLTGPPGSPASGDTYIPAATATGAWAGKEKQIAVWDGAAWVFGVPREGWVASIDDEDLMIRYDGSAWSTGISFTRQANANQAVVTLGNTNSEIGGLTISAAYSQAEVTALRDKCEELADDVRALSVLLHQIRTDLIAFGAIKGSV